MTVPAECIRKAWLTLGAMTMPLEDEALGYYCTELNLGYPEVRDVVSNRPDRNGIDDRSAYFGQRVISANLIATRASLDAVAASFAPYMVPSVRPTLHYVLDRGPDSPERTFTVRASGYSWPIVGSSKHRDIQLQWVAADPVALDPTLHTVTAWAGSTIGGGRVYNLTFNRTYGAEGGSLPTAAVLSSAGDVIVWPLLRIYGPITLPLVTFTYRAPRAPARVQFVAPFVIDAGHYVEVDTAEKTAYRDGDRSLPVLGSIDWLATVWPYIPANGEECSMSLTGDSTSEVTQVQAAWQDRYLS